MNSAFPPSLMDKEAISNSSSTTASSQSTPNGASDLFEASYISSKTDVSIEALWPSDLAVHKPYDPDRACDDISPIRRALDVFLNSHMLEAEDFLDKCDPDKSRLYFASGYGLVQFFKSIMSFADEDLLAAIGHTKHAIQITEQHRKPPPSLAARLADFVTGSSSSHSIAFVESMTMTERHAELVYAESLAEKAILGIVYSGDWLAFIKEALNMRTTISVYKRLADFIDHADAQAVARGEGPEDVTIDAHFRSGVNLGVGLFNLILSLLPGRLMTLVELFGYHGDRQEGLQRLYKTGGWRREDPRPSVSAEEEGLRRSPCDMVLLLFHLVLSSITFEGVDLEMAQIILDWNLERFPNGVFFLFGAGRLAMMRSQPRRALEYYAKAMAVQSQYRNLHHISYWEMAIVNFALWDIHAALDNWRKLEAEGTWSRATYSYGMAVCLHQLGNTEEAAALMEKIPDLRQKIAGKSIPLEKFVARKARKFRTQGNRLALPALELAYIFLAIAHSPREVVTSKMLPAIEAVLSKLREHENKTSDYENGHGFWDDYCLAKFLEGICLRYVAHMDADAIATPEEVPSIEKADAERRAVAAFEFVFANGPKIEYDHHLVYYAHYELGRLLACMGDKDGAQEHLELILSGKYLEVSYSGRKGKYSMESALHFRATAAIEALKKGVQRL